jgi:hypothetical protein
LIDDVPPLSAAERMRRYRARRRHGHSCITVELRESEISALISNGLLKRDHAHDRAAIATALHAYLDRNPISWAQIG